MAPGLKKRDGEKIKYKALPGLVLSSKGAQEDLGSVCHNTTGMYLEAKSDSLWRRESQNRERGGGRREGEKGEREHLNDNLSD